MDNSPCVSAARIWSKNTWLSEKHINKYIQSIARAFFFLSVRAATSAQSFPFCCKLLSFLLNKKKEKKRKEKKKEKRTNAGENVLRVELQRSSRAFLFLFFFLDAKLTDIHKSLPIFWPALNCIDQDCPIHLGSQEGGISGVLWWRQLPR